MQKIYLVQHEYELENGSDETKVIGVYSTRENAEAAVFRLVEQPGFCDRPDNFHIDEYDLDKDHWAEGYITATGGGEEPEKT